MASRFSVEAIFKAVDKMTAPVARMQSGMQRFVKSAEKGIKDLDKAADHWLGGMKKVGIGAAAAFTAAGAGLALAAKPGMEFEQQMANLGAAYLKTRGEIGALEKKALELGAATQFSATDVAGAMEAMAKGGFTEAEALAGIEGMTYAAAAAGEDLVETSAAVSAVMKGMGIDVSQATNVADVLALASVKTASSIGSLAESMSKVGPVAKQLKIPLNDAVAMVASLQDAGLDASEAGSATATMLTMMAKPSDAIAAKMKKLKISFKDAAGNMKSPALVLGELVKAGKGAGGNMEQLAFFADLVGLRGQKAAINLKGLFESGKYGELVEDLDHATGTAKKMSDLRMATLTGDLDKMSESIKTIAIDAYSAQSSGLRGITQGMTEWIDKNRELISQNVGAFFKAIADNIESIVTWGRRIGTVVAVITAAALAVKVWTGAVWLLSAAIDASPISLIAIAIVGAIALILAFWPEISGFFSDLWSGITDIASRIASSIGGVFSAIWEPVKTFLTAAFETYVGLVTLIVSPILAALKPVFDFWIGVAAWVVQAWQPVGAFFGMLWEGIRGAAQVAFDFLLSIANTVIGALITAWSAVGTFFANLWQGIKDTFLSVLGPVFDKISWAIDKVRSVGRDTLGTNEENESAGAGAPAEPQVVSPQARVASSISETTTTSKSELTIRDTTGKAVMSKKPSTPGIGIRLQQSGAF